MKINWASVLFFCGTGAAIGYLAGNALTGLAIGFLIVSLATVLDIILNR